MSKRNPGSRLGFAAIVLLSFLIGACSVGESKGMKPSADWSKGVPVADRVQGSIGFALQPDGQEIYLVYPQEVEGSIRLHYRQLDEEAAPVVDRDLDIPLERLRSPRLLLAAEGRLHLFWGDRRDGGPWGVWYARLGRDGQLDGDPVRITPEETDVVNFDVAPAGGGKAVLVWDSRAAPAIYGTRVSPSGQLEGDPVLIAEGGSAPSVTVAADNSLDLTWSDEEGIRYASFPEGSLAPAEGVRVAELTPGTGDTLFGPVVGRSEGWVYVFWSILRRSGLQAGSAATFFVSFPVGGASEVSGSTLVSILPLEDQPYQPYSGIFTLSQMVPGAPSSFRSGYVYEPYPYKSELAELAVGVATEQALRQDLVVQVATLLFENGEYKGYTFSGRTPGFSGEPSLSVDSDGNLFMVWKDGSAGESIYLATTSPDMRASLDQVEASDIVNTVLQGGIEGAATILLFPLAIPWVVPGYILLGLWKIFRDFESLASRSSWVVLVLALALFEVTKVVFLPTILEYVPFSAWIDVPSWLEGPLRILFPILTIGLGVALAEINRRRGSESTLLYYTIVVFTDLLVTLAVYGVAYLGVF